MAVIFFMRFVRMSVEEPQYRRRDGTNLFLENCWVGCREPASGSDLPMKALLLSSDCQVRPAKERDVVESLPKLSPPFDLVPSCHGDIGSFAQSFDRRR